MKSLKRVILGLIVLILVTAILSGCAKLGSSEDTYIPDSTGADELADTPMLQTPSISVITASTEGYENNRTANTDRMSRGMVLESSTGVYYLNLFDYNVSLIEYFESAAGPRIILCGKPECHHNTTSCNAYVDSELLGMYNDRLYYSGSMGGSKICSMALDGSNHRTDIFVPDEYIKHGSGVSTQMDSGYIYCTDNSFEEDKASFFRISLEDQSVEYVVSEDFSISGYLDCYPYGDTLYILTVETVDGKRVDTYYAYSFTDKELVNLSKITEGTLIACTNTTLYTSTGHDVWAHDIATGESTLLFEIDSTKMCSKAFDGTYFYIEEWSTEGIADTFNMFIYDTSGELKSTIPMNFEGRSSNLPVLYTVTKDSFIFTLSGDSLDYAAFKSDIEKGEINFVDISDN